VVNTKSDKQSKNNHLRTKLQYISHPPSVMVEEKAVAANNDVEKSVGSKPALKVSMDTKPSASPKKSAQGKRQPILL
jgi:hypothetical protein